MSRIASQTHERDPAQAKRLAGLLRRRDVRYLVIASRGSSSNAARYAQYLLGRANRVPVTFATPSLHTLYEIPVLLVISWRGEDRSDAPEHWMMGEIMAPVLALIETAEARV